MLKALEFINFSRPMKLRSDWEKNYAAQSGDRTLVHLAMCCGTAALRSIIFPNLKATT